MAFEPKLNIKDGAAYMKITVFGLGFVGLTTALGFAERGHAVCGVDNDGDRRAEIAGGGVPFEEPGLGEALRRHLGNNFRVDLDAATAAAAGDCIFYCVGTPCGADGNADLTFLYSALELTLAHIKDGKYRLLAIKSTVPPTTAADRIIPFVESRGYRVGVDVGVANNPEFLREGSCWSDFMNADRIVFGVRDGRDAAMLNRLYAPWGVPLFAVSLNTAEYIKYLSNALLATLISFSNEMAVAAEAIGGVDTAKAFDVLRLDRRWSSEAGGGPCGMTGYVYPGCGYGGYCLPKDTKAFYAFMRGCGLDCKLLGDVIKTNEEMPLTAARKITRGMPATATIGVLGLAFKPGSDDARDSPAAKIIAEILELGFANVCAFDPAAVGNFSRCHDLPIEYAGSLREVIDKADVLAILTAWDEFRGIREMTDKPIADCRYMLR
jgi:UDPglucose 6-dehydrogenase